MTNTKYILSTLLIFAVSFLLKAQEDSSNADYTLTGKWTLTSVSAYAPPGSLPEYSPGDYIWDFGDGDSYQITVTKNNPKLKEDHFALPAGKYQFWSRKCLVKINDRTFQFGFNNNSTNSSNSVQLYLSSNLDPRIPDAGYSLTLVRVEE